MQRSVRPRRRGAVSHCRYHTKSLNYHIFSTRSTINLEYEGTSFSKWSVPDMCSVGNESSPNTMLRCSTPGMHAVKPLVTGTDDEEERYLFVANSHICFLWYYKTINHYENLTQTVIIWVYDPENAKTDELLWEAETPSLNSQVLSEQLDILGQMPTVHTVMKKRSYSSTSAMINGTWVVNVPMTSEDVIKQIKSNPVAFQDCFIADFSFLLTFPILTIPEHSHHLPITLPAGSPVMCAWIACVVTYAILISDQETIQTNDSFLTWTRIRVPSNVLSDAERHNVTDVDLSKAGIFFVINSMLYLKTSTSFKKVGRNKGLPESGLLGITTRKWCWIKSLFKNERRKSIMIAWTEDEVYLGYSSYRFFKIMTTAKLKTILNIPPTDTLKIQNAEYTGHPLEIGLLLNHCVTCTTNKLVYIVIYNEDSAEWTFQDFKLEVPIDTVLSQRFLYSALPEVILWDKNQLYYSYENFTVTGILQISPGQNNLSLLSNGSNIHDVFVDYMGSIIVKMENNIMFYFKTYVREAIKLHSWINNTIKSAFLFSVSSELYLIYVFDNGTVKSEDYPLNLEIRSATYKAKEKCPYMAFHDNVGSILNFLDKGENLSVWAQIVYPENVGLSIIVDVYGPDILKQKQENDYEVALGYCTKSLVTVFFQNINYEGSSDYFQKQKDNMGLLLIQLRPSEYSKVCPVPLKVFQIAVGCDVNKHILVRGFSSITCRHRDFSYIIDKSYLRQRPSKNLKVLYDWAKYGCPLKLNFKQKFQPVLELHDGNGYVRDVTANFIMWEIHGRDDYNYNNTMKQSGCLNEAQTWKKMTMLYQNLSLDDVWGPQNYKPCFSYAIGKPGDLNQPYEIMNLTNNNYVYWPMDHSGMYVFRVKILDPNYSFCNLTATFSIETYGVIPRPSVYLVAAFLFTLMTLVFSLLVLSYLWYMKIYRQFIFEPLSRPQSKEKKS
uniref:cation channel sperm-associated protein subunit epsilon n=1 Tax=Jaculus jaculus TaxID=51337 RepID=UPI001E1B3FBB|nr:cation channel sperm-associated protein subunit epsilon [Jaculus jaculus]